MCESFYTKMSQAKNELANRKHLRRNVEDFWSGMGITFPECILQGYDLAIIARQLATFRFEDAKFILMAEAMGLRPCWPTYLQDKFVSQSKLKMSYVRPKLASRFNGQGQVICRYDKLVKQIDSIDGKPLCAIQLSGSVSLADYHRSRLLKAYPQADICDVSSMFAQCGKTASAYYLLALSLYVAHGVLIEDYHGGESGKVLDSFTADVFEPAFKKAADLFGAKAIIVKLPWWEELGYYPDGQWLDNWRDCASILSRE